MILYIILKSIGLLLILLSMQDRKTGCRNIAEHNIHCSPAQLRPHNTIPHKQFRVRLQQTELKMLNSQTRLQSPHSNTAIR